MKLELSKSDKEYIRTYVAEGKTDEEKITRRGECAEVFGLTIAQIRAISAWTTIRAKRAMQAQEGTATQTAAVLTEASAPVLPSNLPTSSILGEEVSLEGGEHVDYNNEAKNKWRAKWFEFLGQHTTPAERAAMKVLCLPGKKCLEIPGYLELGFRPENITGVEGGDRNAREEFQVHAERYGIRPVVGRMENFVEDDKTYWGVVSLDFLGPLSLGYTRISNHLLLADRALALVNVMGKRERGGVQSDLHLYNNSRESRRNIDDVRNAVNTWTSGSYEGDLSDAREQSLGELFFTTFSILRAEQCMFPQKINALKVPAEIIEQHDRQHAEFPVSEDALVLRKKYYALLHYLSVLLGTFEQLLLASDYKPERAKAVALQLYRLVTLGAFTAPLVTEHAAWKYRSAAGSGSTNYYSDFAVLTTPRSTYRKTGATIKFFLDSVGEMLAVRTPEAEDIGSITAQHKTGHYLNQNDRLATSDVFVFESRRNVRMSPRIRVGRLLEELDIFLKGTYEASRKFHGDLPIPERMEIL